MLLVESMDFAITIISFNLRHLVKGGHEYRTVKYGRRYIDSGCGRSALF